ncbi:hypothetical protein N9N19_05840 [Porticoccaceae bacterium]|nr:hypothetical protein [Porticoccaceae bacterium]
MNSFDLGVLILPTLAIFFVCVMSCFYVTREPKTSLLLSFVKSGAFILYFGLFFDGSYILGDDLSYFKVGLTITEQQITFFNFIGRWDEMMALIPDGHKLYYIYNTVAIKLFGGSYFSAVALNVILTVAIAYYGTTLVVREGWMSPAKGKLFFAFLLIHPYIFIWSNTVNIKDILVLFLTVLLLHSVSLFFKYRISTALFIGFIVSVMFLFLRFYIPLMFAVALILSLFVLRGGRYRRRLLFYSSIPLFALFGLLGLAGLQAALREVTEYFVNPMFGIPRFILTPVPFNTGLYSFLDYPALFHWFMMPAVVVGFHIVYKCKTPFAKFFITYFLLMICLYGVAGHFQGPRQRLQLEFMLAVFQFFGFRIYYAKKLQK